MFVSGMGWSGVGWIELVGKVIGIVLLFMGVSSPGLGSTPCPTT